MNFRETQKILDAESKLTMRGRNRGKQIQNGYKEMTMRIYDTERM